MFSLCFVLKGGNKEKCGSFSKQSLDYFETKKKKKGN